MNFLEASITTKRRLELSITKTSLVYCRLSSSSRGRRSDSDQVFRYRSIEHVWVFLHFRSGSGILSLGSVILGRVRIFKF